MRSIPKDVPSSEEWLPVVDYTGLYEVSRYGSIYSDRTDIFLATTMDKDGYLYVILCVNGVRRTKKVHKIVMEAFVGPCPPGKQVNHKDSDRTNNYLSNLEYVTASENIRHAISNGFMNSDHCKGEECNFSILKEEDVIVVRQRCKSGETQRSVADDYGISQPAVSHIVSGKNWAHVA